jgi:hypothetical protein
MSSQCVFVDFADRRKGKGDGAGAILHRLSADDDVGADPNPIGGWREVQFGDATGHAGARRLLIEAAVEAAARSVPRRLSARSEAPPVG